METQTYKGVEDAEPLEEFVVEKPSWNDLQQHEPLDRKIEKSPWLLGLCPNEMKAVTRMAANKATEHLQQIKRVCGAEAQYSLLLHYHRVLGTIPRAVKPAPMTIGEEVAAYNLYQSGLSMPEIAKRLGRAESTIWKILVPARGKPKLKYHHIKPREAAAIDSLHAKGMEPLDIAEHLKIPYRTVRYYLYEKKKHAGPKSPSFFGSVTSAYHFLPCTAAA